MDSHLRPVGVNPNVICFELNFYLTPGCCIRLNNVSRCSVSRFNSRSLQTRTSGNPLFELICICRKLVGKRAGERVSSRFSIGLGKIIWQRS